MEFEATVIGHKKQWGEITMVGNKLMSSDAS